MTDPAGSDREQPSSSRGSAAGWLLAAVIAAAVAYVLIAGIALVSLTLALLGSSAAACVSSTSPVSNVPQPVTSPAAPVDAAVASWNSYGTKNTTAGVVAGIRSISRVAGVIGLQEMNPDHRRIAVAQAIEGFGWDMSTGSNAVPIVWDTSRYRAVAQDSAEVFGIRRIEPGVSGRSIGPKSQQWVQLEDRRTGGRFFVLNFHLVPSIEERGRPVEDKPIRLKLASEQVAAAVAQGNALKRTAPVVFTGDHNMADPAAWLRTRLNPAGYQSSYQLLGQPKLATHGNRRIDYVWSTTPSLVPTRHQVLGSSSTPVFSRSDHRPIVVTLSSSRPASAAPLAAADQLTAGAGGGGCVPCPGTALADVGGPGSTKTGDWDKMGARDPDGKPPITGVLEPTVRKAAEIVHYAVGRGAKIDTVYAAPPRASMWGTGEHGLGRAIDVMVGSIRDGDIVADYAWQHRERFRVKWIVWNHKIRSPERNSGTWRAYSGTDNMHEDHPHIFFDEGPYVLPSGTRLATTTTAATSTSVSLARGSGSWADPIDGGVVGARFGATGSWSRYHTGDDYRAGFGTKIHAVAAGRVVFAGSTGNWAGNHVAVQHTDGWTTMYSHMSDILVSKDQTVSAGTVVGLVGSTGRSFGPHLHFETYPPGVRHGDVYSATDPQKYMAKLKKHGGPAGTGGSAPAPITGGTFAGVRLNAAQVGLAAQIIATVDSVGGQLGWDAMTSNQAKVVAVITAMQESQLGEYPGFDRPNQDNDAGYYQQRVLPGWYSSAPTPQGRLRNVNDIVWGTRTFLLGNDKNNIPGLQDINGWQSMAPTQAAQAVQVSDYPDAYAKWVPMANDLIVRLGRQGTATADQGACGPETDSQLLAMAGGR